MPEGMIEETKIVPKEGPSEEDKIDAEVAEKKVPKAKKEESAEEAK